jgi:hypothetical protein
MADIRPRTYNFYDFGCCCCRGWILKKLTTKILHKLAKMRAAPFLQSCRKNAFIWEYPLSYGGFWSSFDYKHKNISPWAAWRPAWWLGTSCVCQLFTQTADLFWMSTNFDGVKVCTHDKNWATKTFNFIVLKIQIIFQIYIYLYIDIYRVSLYTWDSL